MILADSALRDNRTNAFTVVEVLVVLGIVAALMALGGYAINEGQRFSRAQDRVNKAGEIAGAVNDYLRINGNLPSETTGSFEWSANQVRVGTKAVELRGYLIFEASNTTVSHTNYSFVREFGDFQVCVQQETGEWEGVGSGTDLCP